MTMSTALATRIAQEHAEAADTLALNTVAGARRRHALEVLQARGLPTSRDENWKYANLRLLERTRFSPATGQHHPTIAASDLPYPIERYARYTFVDGFFAPELSMPRDQSGLSIRSLHEVQNDSEFPQAHADARFALLNDAFATDGARIVAAPGADCSACLELVFVASVQAQNAASYPRIELDVGAHARVGLIERHVSLGSDANFVNCAVRINIAQNARVEHFRLQQAGARATWIDTLSATLASDALYRLYLINLGAQASRSTMHIKLAEARAELGLHAISVADQQQVHDAFALVEHLMPHTLSRQNFRGIAGGRSRVAFNSKVVVRESAQGTDSHQSLRGLLAGTDAEINVRPQLEIYTDDVRCAHGATAGKLDEAMLFYLLSRGLDRETARRLLEWAFLEDVVAKIEVPELRRQIEQSLAGQMKESAALEGLL